MRIFNSARKHGIMDNDMISVYNHHTSILRLRENPMKYLCFGFANTIVGIEIGVIHSDAGEPAIFHAMKCRKKYEKYLVLEGDYYDYE